MYLKWNVPRETPRQTMVYEFEGRKYPRTMHAALGGNVMDPKYEPPNHVVVVRCPNPRVHDVPTLRVAQVPALRVVQVAECESWRHTRIQVTATPPVEGAIALVAYRCVCWNPRDRCLAIPGLSRVTPPMGPLVDDPNLQVVHWPQFRDQTQSIANLPRVFVLTFQVGSHGPMSQHDLNTVW